METSIREGTEFEAATITLTFDNGRSVHIRAFDGHNNTAVVQIDPGEGVGRPMRIKMREDTIWNGYI